MLVLGMGADLPGLGGLAQIPVTKRHWIELGLATPVVLWGGRPFFVRGWRSVLTRSLNMFTLIALGVGAAFFFSLPATIVPRIFPASFRGPHGEVGVYFLAAALVAGAAERGLALGQVRDFAAGAPQDKSAVVERYQAQGHTVAMAGDGINDAPAAVMGNIRQNLFFAFVYNVLGIQVAAGALYPFTKTLLSPSLAAAAMALSSVSVISNALRLRRVAL